MSEKTEGELQEAARRVVYLLQNALSDQSTRDRDSADQGQAGGHRSQQQNNGNIEQCMARSFPGLFGKKIAGKKRPHSVFKQNFNPVKCFPVQFYLVNEYMEKTPKVSDELTLLQAGLGRRTINIAENADHSWLSGKLEEAYSKMACLKGAWMLYKAVGNKWKGGSGQRKLCIVPPEAEGYTGAYLSTVARGKSTLYIVPVQGTLDTSPLPYSAKEFEKMPKATCHTCSVNLPIQLLAAHVACCEDVEVSNDTDEQNDLLELPSNGTICDSFLEKSSDDALKSALTMEESAESILPSSGKSLQGQGACPICDHMFPKDVLEMHSSFCGERTCDDPNVIPLDDTRSYATGMDPKQYKADQEMKSITDVIQTLNERVDETNFFNISVTRDQILERGIKQWQRQKKSSPIHALRVSFIGENGIDNGALRKEFLTEMMAGIENRFFEGGDDGKTPKYSMIDMDKHNFSTVGEVFAASIAQGGPPPNFLMEWCYTYMATGEIDQDRITATNVTDPDLKELIKEIQAADESTLMTYMDRVLSCGYTGPVSSQRKEDMIRSVILHATMRLLPMLQQICSGMKLYGFHSLIQEEREICRQLFVSGSFGKVDADFLVKSLSPVFSEAGTMRRQRESRIVYFLQDFVQDLEDEEEESNGRARNSEEENEDPECADHAHSVQINVVKFFQWLTGQRHIPLSITERNNFKIVMEFDHDCEVRFGTHIICYPSVNACSCSVSFPVAHMATYAEFRTVISQAIVHSNQFGLH